MDLLRKVRCRLRIDRTGHSRMHGSGEDAAGSLRRLRPLSTAGSGCSLRFVRRLPLGLLLLVRSGQWVLPPEQVGVRHQVAP